MGVLRTVTESASMPCSTSWSPGSGGGCCPRAFPPTKPCNGGCRGWVQQDAFRRAWQQLAQRYEVLQGINWDEVLLDGAKKPAKKGANRPARVPWIAANAARPCI